MTKTEVISKGGFAFNCKATIPVGTELAVIGRIMPEGNTYRVLIKGSQHLAIEEIEVETGDVLSQNFLVLNKPPVPSKIDLYSAVPVEWLEKESERIELEIHKAFRSYTGG